MAGTDTVLAREALVTPRPYTPETLAERWRCSANTVRRLCKRQELRSFRLGGKLWRIPAEAVEEFECQNSGLSAIVGDMPSSTMKAAGATGIRLARMIEHKHGSNSHGS